MDIRPPRTTGFLFGLLIGGLCLFGIGWSVFQLGQGGLSLLLALWVVLPLLCLLLLLFVLYRLYGLATARYTIDRDGFKLRWGLANEHIPIDKLTRVDRAQELGMDRMPPIGSGWPGLYIGKRNLEDFGELEYFATRGPGDMVIVQSEQGSLAISPPDVEPFLKAVTDSLRMGALSSYEELSTRPNFAVARIGADRPALVLVLTGGLLPLALLGFLTIMVGELSGQVAFGFDASGMVDTFAPPVRLLLLPMIAGAGWFIDLFLGMWMYRTTANRPLAYAFWGGAILVGILMWGAVLQLLNIL